MNFSVSEKRPDILTTAHRITLVCVMTLALGLIALDLISLHYEAKSQETSIRESYLQSQKTEISREVERLVESIEKRRAELAEKGRRLAKERVYRAHSVMRNLYREYRGEVSALELRNLMLAALEPARFDRGSGYYFVVPFEETETPGADRPGPKDEAMPKIERPEVRAHSQDFTELVRNQREGVLEYKWPTPGGSGARTEKIFHVKLFEPYNLIVGTGLYLADLEAELKNELLKEIARIRFGENGYFFVDNYAGEVLAHGAQQELVGTSILNYEDSRGTLVFQELRKTAKNPEGGFSHYWWRMPKSGTERPKIAFAMVIPDWEWLIGTGLYVDEVESMVEAAHSSLKRQAFYHVLLITVVSGFLIAFSYFLTGFMFRDLRRDVMLFEESLRLAAQEDVAINEQKIRYAELHNVATNVNRMLQEKETIYRSTLRGMNHILNNFLNNMSLFKLYAEESDDFPEENVEEIERIINETAEHIKEYDLIERINKPNIDKISFKNGEG